MADDDDIDDDDVASDDDGEEGEDGESSGGKKSKKKLFIIIGLVLLIIIGAGAAAFFTGLINPLSDSSEEKAEDADGKDGEGGSGQPGSPGGAVFHNLPDMRVTLNTGGRRPVVLVISVSLELTTPEDIPKVNAVMPRIVDNFQVYLRELRVDDLKGSAGMYRLREELLTRVSAAAAPVKVNAVLFNQMLVQ